jgi:hypothetical protein
MSSFVGSYIYFVGSYIYHRCHHHRAAAKLPPTSCSRAAATAADAAAAAAPPPSYVALSRCRAAAKQPTMLTRSNLIGIPRVIDHNDPTDVQFFLDRFEKYRNTTDKRKLPDEIQFYGRASHAQDALTSPVRPVSGIQV